MPNVTAVNLWTAGENADGDWDFKRSYVHKYKVGFDGVDPMANAWLALNASFGGNTIPAYGASHPFDTRARVKQKSAAPLQNDNHLWYVVTVTYSTGDRKRCGEEPTHPLEEPPVQRLSMAKFQKALDVDLEGNPVRNSAGQKFGEDLLVDDSRPQIVISLNLANDPEATGLVDTYRDAVNSDTWRGRPPGTCKIEEISVDVAYDDDCVAYFPTTFVIAVNPDGWQPKKLDHGFAYRDDDGKLIVTHDDYDNQLNEQVLLDGNGKIVAADGPPASIDFVGYRDEPFGLLNLPQSLTG